MQKKVYLSLSLCLLMLIIAPWTCTAANEKEGIILVAFGTSMPEAKIALDAIHEAYTRTTNTPIIWAYTSDIIRRKLAKQGEKHFSVMGAMNEAARLGIRRLRMQSLHVGAAQEFQSLQQMIVRNLLLFPDRFESVLLGRPLIESQKDMLAVRDALLQSLPKERTPNDAVVFMGHGNHNGPGDLMLYSLNAALQHTDPLIYVAAVEGGSAFEPVLAQLKKQGIKKVWFQPLMIVAGDHARNDMAGNEADSWASQAKAAGIESAVILRGLGELPAIQSIFIKHTKDAWDNFAHQKKAD